jgi:endonuclease-3
VYQLSEILIARYQSEVPLTFEQLIELPGIGQKTANVILNVLTNAKTIAVDTHVMRVSKRLGLIDESVQAPRDVEAALYQIVPEEYWNRVNHWLVLHGRYVCTARKPYCDSCILKSFCANCKRSQS